MRTVRLQVTLRDVEPRVQRVIDVPAGITLDELHEVLQVAIGWTDSHLHQFRTDDAIYSIPFEDWADEEVDERGVRLSTRGLRWRWRLRRAAPGAGRHTASRARGDADLGRGPAATVRP